MASRYGGITGSKRISDDFQNINTAFENVQADVDARKNETDKVKADLEDHKTSASAHKAENITYSGDVIGADNVKQALDKTKQTIDDLVLGSGDSGPEVAGARGGYPTLGDRLDASDSRVDDIAINIRLYGAMVDGQTDDTQAVQAAIDDVHSKGGGVVLIPSGICVVSGLTIRNNVTIKGGGKQSSTIRLKNGANNHVIATQDFDTLIGTNPGTDKLAKTCGLKMICVDGNKDNQTVPKHGLAYLGIDLQMEEVEIKNASDLGCWIESSINVWSVQVGRNLQTNIRHIDVHDNQNGNFYYNGQSDSTMVDIVCYETGTGSGEFNFKLGPNAMGVRVIGLHCWGVSDYGIVIEPDSTCFTNTHVESATVAKVWIKKFTVFEGRIYEVGTNTSAPAFIIDPSIPSNRIEAQVFNCDIAVKFNGTDGGSGLYDIMMYSPNASAIIFSGTLSTTNFVRARLTGAVQSNIFMSPNMRQVPGSNWDFSTPGNNYAFYTDEAKANRQFGIENTTNSNSWIAATGGIGGVGGALLARGSATDIDLRLIPQGNGRIRFGTHAPTSDVAITGFIEIKDINGTIRKLAVIS